MAAPSTLLTVHTGARIAVPAPALLIDALERVEVTTSDETRSGFQLVLAAGRRGPADLADSPLLRAPLLRPFDRVVLTVTFAGTPSVLIDGVVTHRELTPGQTPGGTRLTVTGEDVSVLMDLEERTVEHPAQDEAAIATAILGSHAGRLGLTPRVVAPPSADPPLAVDRVPVQQGTDLAYLTEMAGRFGYVCYVEPGRAPMTNTAYWGPRVRTGPPQRALSVDLGPESTVDDLTFRQDGLAPTRVVGDVQDRRSQDVVTVRGTPDVRPALARTPDPPKRTTILRESGVSATTATARAQGAAAASTDSLVATGRLDALRYRGLLTPRRLVEVRGAGRTHDGLFAVRRVTHSIERGTYTQAFTLAREGTGATVAGVRA